jgi:hypothetical protein
MIWLSGTHSDASVEDGLLPGCDRKERAMVIAEACASADATRAVLRLPLGLTPDQTLERSERT